MASLSKRSGGWRAQVAIKGVRESATFSTKAEATAWAAQRETELRSAAQTGITTGKTLQDAFDRYGTEVSPHKKITKWEVTRMAYLARYPANGILFGEMLLRDITPSVLGAWRDHRLTVDQVSGATIGRDMNLLSHVFSTAKQEWKWIAGNPISDTRRPKQAAPRDRLISEDEIERLCIGLGFDNAPVRTKMGAVAIAFLFAIETAMRAGEICGLLQEDINGTVAVLRQTKNGDKRNVPLSQRAIELLTYLPGDGETLFNLSPSALDTMFRKVRGRCQIEGMTFHDTRHEAITRLAKKLNVLDLARMVGHRNLNQLQTYYNEAAESIAARLG